MVAVNHQIMAETVSETGDGWAMRPRLSAQPLQRPGGWGEREGGTLNRAKLCISSSMKAGEARLEGRHID